MSVSMFVSMSMSMSMRERKREIPVHLLSGLGSSLRFQLGGGGGSAWGSFANPSEVGEPFPDSSNRIRLSIKMFIKSQHVS
jgi:hypothetical protein